MLKPLQPDPQTYTLAANVNDKLQTFARGWNWKLKQKNRKSRGLVGVENYLTSKQGQMFDFQAKYGHFSHFWTYLWF